MVTRHRHDGSREQWKTLRDELGETHLGGSELGAVMGLCDYETARTLYLRKKGMLPEKDDNEAMRFGRDMEDYVARRFAEVSGKSVHRDNSIIENDRFPHLMASVDRIIANEDSGLECKTMKEMVAGKHRSKYLSGAKPLPFPSTYYVQCCLYLAVTERRRWYLAVYVPGVRLSIYLVTRVREDTDYKPEWCDAVVYVSDEEIAEMEPTAAEFIQRLEDCDCPEPSGAKADTESIVYCNGQSIESVEPPLVDGGILDELARKNGEAKALDEEIAKLENQIKATLGQAESGICSGWKITYRTQTSTRIDAKAVEKHFGGRECVPQEMLKTSSTRPLKISAVSAA